MVSLTPGAYRPDPMDAELDFCGQPGKDRVNALPLGQPETSATLGDFRQPLQRWRMSSRI